MSTARERFAAELGFVGDLQIEDMLQAVLDEHAHELAEQQRAVADANDELDHDHHVYGFSEAVRQVADLIDPPKSAGSVRLDVEPTP